MKNNIDIDMERITLEQIATIILTGEYDIQIEIVDRNYNSVEFFNYSNMKKFDEHKHKFVDAVDVENRVITIWEQVD